MNLKRFMPFFNQTEKIARVRKVSPSRVGINDPVMQRKQTDPPSLINSKNTSVHHRHGSSMSLPMPIESPTMEECLNFD